MIYLLLNAIIKDPETNDFMLVMKYAPGGNLHSYLQKNFTTLTWLSKNGKLDIIWQNFEG